MSKRCELQKEYYQSNGNYKGNGKYCDEYVKWLEEQVLFLRIHDDMARLFDDVTKNTNADRSRVVAGYDKGKLCFYELDLHEETVKRYLTTVSLNVP